MWTLCLVLEFLVSEPQTRTLSFVLSFHRAVILIQPLGSLGFALSWHAFLFCSCVFPQRRVVLASSWSTMRAALSASLVSHPHHCPLLYFLSLSTLMILPTFMPKYNVENSYMHHHLILFNNHYFFLFTRNSSDMC